MVRGRGKGAGNGFASMDALFSILPIALMAFLAMNMGSMLSHEAAERSQQQIVFDKLVSVADYTVKSGAVMRNGSIRYPNWIDEAMLAEEYAENLRAKIGLESLTISLGEPDSEGMCIYRIVVMGQEKRLGRLFVCGG
jgi:Flp pilus assembly protein CpaB